MKNRLKALVFMWGSFLLAVIICLVLTFNSESVRESNVIINIGFFAIVLVIFIYASIRFIKLSKIVNDIKQATETIKSDYSMNNRELLWEKYRNRDFLFRTSELNALFKNYVEENNRLNDSDDFGVYVDIEDYINYQVIDSYVKKNVLNLVTGTMTGLGILGTFIGLSFGLRSFNTGTTKEISNSIAPLMDGIKVAFHTSIYGMLLSLLYSFGYKADLETAYDAIDRFVETFNNKVTPTPESEGLKMVVKYQKQQVEEINILANNISEKMAEKMAELLVPQFAKMNDAIDNFAAVTSKAQLEGVGTIVDKFVEEMNMSLGDSFRQLSVVINETCELQKQNSKYMQDVLQKVSDMTVNIDNINALSVKTVEDMSQYINEIEELQKLINVNMMSVNMQIEALGDINKEQKDYIETFTNHVKTITESSQSVSDAAQKQVENIANYSNSVTNDMDSAAKELGKVSSQLNGQLNKSLTETFETFDKELSTITKHLSGTISEVSDTTERVPKVVMEAYSGMQKSFEEMQENINKLAQAVEVLRVNIEEQAIAEDNEDEGELYEEVDEEI